MYLGRFPFLVCSVCSRVYHPAETSAAIEAAARSRGLFPAEVSDNAVPPEIIVVREVIDQSDLESVDLRPAGAPEPLLVVTSGKTRGLVLEPSVQGEGTN